MRFPPRKAQIHRGRFYFGATFLFSFFFPPIPILFCFLENVRGSFSSSRTAKSALPGQALAAESHLRCVLSPRRDWSPATPNPVVSAKADICKGTKDGSGAARVFTYSCVRIFCSHVGSEKHHSRQPAGLARRKPNSATFPRGHQKQPSEPAPSWGLRGCR